MALGPGVVAPTSCRLGKGRLDAFRLNAVLGPPTVPTNPVPYSGFVGGPYALAWTASGGAASYDVYFGTSPTPPGYGTTPTPSILIPPLTAGTIYYWQVVAKNTYGSTPGPVWGIQAAVPKTQINPSPVHNETNVANAVTLTWEQIDPEPGMTWSVLFGPQPGPYPPTIVTGLTSPSYALPSPLGNNTTYYWDILAKNNAGEEPHLGVWWIFVTRALGAPSGPVPAHGATEVSLATNLSWTAAANATSYDVFLGTTSPPSSLVQSSAALTYNPPSDLGAETIYYWRVRARNSGGTVDGPIWTFATTDPSRLIIRIDGVAPHMRIAGLTVRDNLNDAPNTCTFTVDTTPPHVGQVVQIGLGSVTGSDLLFAGTIQAVEQIYEGIPDNRAWRVQCIDWWQRLNRYKVLHRYEAQSATAIVSDLVTRFGLGFTIGGIAAGLPVVEGGIDFTHEDLGACIRRVMQRVGGYWYVDYTKVVHAFLTEASAPPAALVPTSPTLLLDPGVTHTADLSQIRTRAIVVGGGANATIDVAATDTIIPIDDATWYNPAGGSILIGTSRYTHTGLTIGGAGATVLGMAGPGGGGAPSAALAGIGGVLGTVAYRVTFAAGGGETVPGPASNSVTGIALPAPAPYPSAALAAGLGRLIGAFAYALTYTTTRGETTPGPSSPAVYPAAFTTPSGSGSSVAAEAGVLGVLIGAYNYRHAFVTAAGETLPSPAYGRTATATATPANSPSSLATVNTTGAIRPGAYRWAHTWVTALGETVPGPSGPLTVPSWVAGNTGWSSTSAAGTGDIPAGTYQWATAYVDEWGGVSSLGNPSAQASIPAGGAAVTLNIPIGPAGTVARRIYRYQSPTGPPYKFVGEVQNNTDAQGVDNTKVPGAVYGGNTMGAPVSMSIANTSGIPGVVRARIYRTKIGGSGAYYFVGEVVTSTGSSVPFTDTLADEALTTLAPSLATAGGQQHRVTIQTGPAGTLARRVYRTGPGGVDYKLLVEVQDNTTTSLLDNVAEVSGPAPVLVADAGGQNVTLTVGAAPAGILTQRVYRTHNTGTGTVFLVGEVGPGGGTLLDDHLDPELGEPAPVNNSAGASAVQVSSIPIGPAGVTGRRLYRSDSAGAYRFVAQLSDNTTTGYLDALDEASLGDVAPTTSTIGALTGATQINVANFGGFPSSGGGWVTSGSQHFRYTGIVGNTLVGIPASGPGSLAAPLGAGDELILESALLGVTLTAAVARGESVLVLEERNAIADQIALAMLEGGDSNGIYVHAITDSRAAWRDAQAIGDADLRLFSKPIATVRYAARDRLTVSGKTVHVDLPSLAIVGDFLIQVVTIDQIGVTKGVIPRYTVEASSTRWTFEDLLRQLLVKD